MDAHESSNSIIDMTGTIGTLDIDILNACNFNAALGRARMWIFKIESTQKL